MFLICPLYELFLVPVGGGRLKVQSVSFLVHNL